MQLIKHQAMFPDLIERIDNVGLIAGLVIGEVKHSVPLAKALLTGCVDTIELALRTPIAMDAAQAIKNEIPGDYFRTVLTFLQVKAAAKLGLDFAVAPGCNPRFIEAVDSLKLNLANETIYAEVKQDLKQHMFSLIKK